MSQIPGGNLQLGMPNNPANVGSVQGGGQIGGALNFGTAVGPNDYMGAYQNALNLNQSNYSNILSGYQQTAGRQQTAQQAIEGGYGNLYNQVQGTIQGIGASQQQAINDAYARQSGMSAQQGINSGLGNTTVQQSVQRGNLLDQQKASIALANQMAQLSAGYQSNLGQAGLNYANQANMQNTALSGQQLNWMNSVNSPYPNAQQYGTLALQQGYANRANQLYGQLPRGLVGGAAGGGANISGMGGGLGGGFAGLGGGSGGGGGGLTMGPSSYGGVPAPRQQINTTVAAQPVQQPQEPGAGPYGVDQYGNPLPDPGTAAPPVSGDGWDSSTGNETNAYY